MRRPLRVGCRQHGLICLTCPAPFAKIIPLASDPNQFISLAVSSHQRGGSRSSRTRGGMRWTPIAPLTNGAERGRRSRVVLTPRRWRQVCVHHAGDGDNKARSPGRARRKPLKPLRAGMPGETGEPVVTNSYAFLFCMRGCGCAKHPAFPTPFL